MSANIVVQQIHQETVTYELEEYDLEHATAIMGAVRSIRNLECADCLPAQEQYADFLAMYLYSARVATLECAAQKIIEATACDGHYLNACELSE